MTPLAHIAAHKDIWIEIGILLFLWIIILWFGYQW